MPRQNSLLRSGLVVYPSRPLTALTRANLQKGSVLKKRLASAYTPNPEKKETLGDALTAGSINIG